jgi:hypothetical protein
MSPELYRRAAKHFEDMAAREKKRADLETTVWEQKYGKDEVEDQGKDDTENSD